MSEIVPTMIVGREKIGTNAASDVDMLHTRNGCDLVVKIDKCGVVGEEVFAMNRLDAAIARTATAQRRIFAPHTVHIGRRPP